VRENAGAADVTLTAETSPSSTTSCRRAASATATGGHEVRRAQPRALSSIADAGGPGKGAGARDVYDGLGVVCFRVGRVPTARAARRPQRPALPLRGKPSSGDGHPPGLGASHGTTPVIPVPKRKRVPAHAWVAPPFSPGAQHVPAALSTIPVERRQLPCCPRAAGRSASRARFASRRESRCPHRRSDTAVLHPPSDGGVGRRAAVARCSSEAVSGSAASRGVACSRSRHNGRSGGCLLAGGCGVNARSLLQPIFWLVRSRGCCLRRGL
jgi:hypothetical protein